MHHEKAGFGHRGPRNDLLVSQGCRSRPRVQGAVSNPDSSSGIVTKPPMSILGVAKRARIRRIKSYPSISGEIGGWPYQAYCCKSSLKRTHEITIHTWGQSRYIPARTDDTPLSVKSNRRVDRIISRLYTEGLAIQRGTINWDRAIDGNNKTKLTDLSLNPDQRADPASGALPCEREK